MGKELISFDDFKIEEKEINSETLDFDNPMSIASYGSDVLDVFAQLRDNLPFGFEDSNYRSYEFTDPMGKIEAFNRSLSGEEDSSKEKIRKNRFANGICTMLNRVSRGHIDLLHENENFADTYVSYLDNVQKICVQMQKDRTSLLNDVKFFKKFKEYVEMLQKQLEDLIVSGEAATEAYKATVDSEDIAKMVYVDVATERLMALRTTVQIMKGLCAQIDLKNAGSFRQMIKYDEYLKVTAPTLNIYASLAVGVKRDAGKIERLLQVREMANDTIELASGKLADNLESILELDKDSLITSDTIDTVVQNYYDGVRLLSNSQQQKENMRTQILAKFERYDQIFSDYEDTITRALMGSDVFETGGKELKGKSKVKRLR